MKSPIRLSVAGLFASLAASAASAQILEIEPNDSKGQATPAANMPSGQYLLGNSVSGTGIGLDYWLVSTAPAAPGIYRHELALSTTGTAGHTGHIRGLNQTGTAPVCPSTGSGGSAGATDSIVQTSSTASQPPRMNAWYGFGKSEQIYYECAGTASTVTNYNATLSTTAVVPALLAGNFNPGTITIQTAGQTTVDTDIVLLDANFDIVLDAVGSSTNDDEFCGTTLQSKLVRTLAPGTYYVGVGAFNSCSSLPAPGDDDYVVGLLLDFPNSFVCSTTGTGSDRDLQVSDGVTTTTSSGVLTTKYYEVMWYTFTVGSAPVGFCEPGLAGVMSCPCANPPSGPARGCENSAATGGASISASGTASLASDSLVLTTANQRPTGTTIVLQGTANNGTGLPFGQGVRCVGGTLKRLYLKTASGGSITAPVGADPKISVQSAALGDTITSGQHRYYMVYYRDPIVLGGCAANLTFNGSAAVDVTWN